MSFTYRAVLNQDGTTAAPTADVDTNTFPGTMAVTRIGVGQYRIISSYGNFQPNTCVFVSAGQFGRQVVGERWDLEAVEITQLDSSNQPIDGLDMLSVAVHGG